MTRLVMLNQALRLTDNPLLQQQDDCIALLQQQDDCIALVLLEKKQFFGSQFGITRASRLRLGHQLWLVEDFRLQLAKLQLPLLCVLADSTELLPQLIKTLGISAVTMAEPVAEEERQLQQLAAHYVPVSCVDLNSLLGDSLRPELAAFPDSFSQFRKAREPELRVSSACADNNISGRWLGATELAKTKESAAWLLTLEANWQQQLLLCPKPHNIHIAAGRQQQAQFLAYLYENKAIYHYKQSRNQFCDVAADGAMVPPGQTPGYASFLSTALSHGSLSVRWVWQQICQLEQSLGANDSTYWLKFELLWREYFRWHQRKFGAALFRRQGLGRHPVPESQGDMALQQLKFQLWCQGQTGVPLVDANMRFLLQTGLMSNRGRQLVASYLIYDLALDWRFGAAFFEQQLLDYDVASNWGNWAYIAGAGTAPGRYFNQLKQALQYDPAAVFIRSQLPELRSLGMAAHLPYVSSIAAPYAAQLGLPPARPDWHSSLEKLQQQLQNP
ncbi:FAD-binding domain-containing protein [Rheinheimera sp. 4Y26]|uniref:FAD-binding domain-containing protein n=1 Tax=Rheinheimera sp. 4Y26 TaxID=2977811 RepID=UPI0021B14C6E|nr:FAD-binding domain-containing protein [Rheinheimera sp. 4Y26]MCT6700873.1 deoxyribodipyrimidine photo-lyase [Rheinheimera sp. 4Y26]